MKDVLYLAVAALPQGREETPIGVQVHDKSVIQIWAISVLSEEHTTLQAPPQLEFLIAVDSEVVHSLAWCPWPGASNASRMGILAVAGGGGASWVYHVPRPTHVRAAAGTSSEEGRAGDAPPIVKLRPWVEHQCAEGYATCIAWSAQTEVPLQNKDPRSSGAAVPREPTGLGGFLAVAGTDGCTTILPCTSPAEEPGMGASGGLLSEGMVLLGAGERNGITSVAWLERGARYLATGHYDGRIKYASPPSLLALLVWTAQTSSASLGPRSAGAPKEHRTLADCGPLPQSVGHAGAALPPPHHADPQTRLGDCDHVGRSRGPEPPA